MNGSNSTPLKCLTTGTSQRCFSPKSMITFASMQHYYCPSILGICDILNSICYNIQYIVAIVCGKCAYIHQHKKNSILGIHIQPNLTKMHAGIGFLKK